MSRFNTDHLRRFLQYILNPALGCVEFRIFRATMKRPNCIEPGEQFSKTLGGWYDRLDNLIVDIQTLKNVSGFVTVNPVTRDLLSRVDHKVAKLEKGGGTSDSQIVALCWMFLDFDAERPADISATYEEMLLALAVRDKFLADHPEIAASAIWGCSGNGGFILVRLPVYPNDETHNALVKRAIASISREYSTDRVKVDPKTSNASRVMGIPGTKKCKGSDRPERPWRLATLDSPEGHDPAPLDLAAWLAARPQITVAEADALGRPKVASSHASGTTSQATGWAASDPRTIRRVAAFVAAIPPAISGQGGHNQTFSVATALVKGFNLTIEEAWPFLVEYNRSCLPPWTEAELRHKIEDADAVPDDKPRGYLVQDDNRVAAPTVYPSEAGAFDLTDLNGQGPAPAGGQPPAGGQATTPAGGSDDVVIEVETSHQIARSVVRDFFTGPQGPTLRYWREDYWHWDESGCYRPIPKREMMSLVSRSIERQFLADYRAKTAAFEIAKRKGDDKARPPKLKSVGTTVVGDVLLALSDVALLRTCDCPSQPAWLDGDGPWPASEVLPTRDSLVHLPSLILGRPATLPPTPNFFGRYTLGYGYDPNAPEPTRWMTFLHQLWPDDHDTIQLLQEWMGYLLTPDTSQQKIAMLIGPPRSGKGTITRVITLLMGEDNVTNPTLSALASNFGLAPLLGKPAAIINEVRVGAKTDTAVVVERLLSISGEDAQTVDRKHKSEQNCKLPTRFMLVSNELPNIRDVSNALTNRMLILQLRNTFLGVEDHQLLGKLIAELPGILRWSIAGWARLRERGHFYEPKGSQDSKQAMADLTSPIGAFIRERCVIDNKACVHVSTLVAAWKTWCVGKGREHPGEEETFGRNLRAAVPDIKKTRLRVAEGNGRANAYTGIRLKTESEILEEDNQAHAGDDDYILPAY